MFKKLRIENIWEWGGGEWSDTVTKDSPHLIWLQSVHCRQTTKSSLEDLEQWKISRRNLMLSNNHVETVAQESKKNEDFDLDDLSLEKIIGTGWFLYIQLSPKFSMFSGSFATVKLCRDVKSSKYYALKTMSIIEMIKLKQVEHIKNEKSVLNKVKHPFIIQLLWSYIDRNFIYFLFPFINGGELFYHLRKCERFPVERVRFYSAEIVSAIAYLHSLKIVYRLHLSV